MKSRAGLWYEAMRTRGDSDEVIGTQFIGGKSFLQSYRHADTDGVGAYYRFLSSQNVQNLALKGLGSSQKIPVWRRLVEFFKAFRRIRSANVIWTMRKIPLPEYQFFYLMFTDAELAQLKKICRQKNLNLRVYLLSCFHPYFSTWLRRSTDQGSWLIPVSLRRPDQLSNYDNLASYFLLPVYPHSTAESINQDFRKQIKSGAYWGTFWMLYLVSLWGRRVVQFLSDRNAHRGQFMGTFSDLGEWTFTHSDPEVQTQMWTSAPLASTQYPIGVSKLIINNKMSLGIRINRRIQTPDAEVIKSDLQKIKEGLFSGIKNLK